jgi:biopolymer transport protein ExbB
MNPRELSPWSMFAAADTLVKAVIVTLALASLVSWTIFFSKSLQLFLARRQLRRRLARVGSCKTLAEAQLAAGRGNNVMSSLLAAAVDEIRASSHEDSGNIQARAASRFSDIVRTEVGTARSGMGVLATIGSTAPFVGLFGTVWGIMNSFIGISKAQTTNLAVVAPGIAEALLATAVGLAVAIPAVVIYNYFVHGIKAYLQLANQAAGALGRMLSRELNRGHGVALGRRAE